MSARTLYLEETGTGAVHASATSMDLVLVRHATSTRAAMGIWGRRFDAPLAPGFEAQLAETVSALRAIGDPMIFSSPLLRCRQTAAYIFPDREILAIDEFIAYHSGDLEQMTEESVRQRYPAYPGLTFRDRFLEPAFGEESIAAQVQRVAHGLLRVLDGYIGTKVIVAHYSSINIIAHIAARNFDTRTYADGTYDLRDGAHLRLTVNPSAITGDLEWHLPRTA